MLYHRLKELGPQAIDHIKTYSAHARRRKDLKAGLLTVLAVVAAVSTSFAQEANVSASRDELTSIQYDDPVRELAFSPDSRWLAAWSDLAPVQLIEVGTGQKVAINDMISSARNVVFSPDGRWVAALNSQGSSLHDTANGKRVFTFGTVQGEVKDVAFSSDNRRLAAVSDAVFSAGARYVRVFEIASGNMVVSRTYYGGVDAIALSSELLAVGGRGEGEGKVIEIASGTERASLGYPTSLAFSPDGRLLAIGSSDTDRLIETVSGSEVARIPGTAIAFSPDGRLLVTGSDGSARLIDMATGTEVGIAHDGEIRTHIFSPDGRWLETESRDGAVRLIETATGREVDRMAMGNGVRAAAFSPNGGLLAIGSGDATVRLLRVNP